MMDYIVETDYHFLAWRTAPQGVSEPSWWPVVQVLEHHFPDARIASHPWFVQYLVLEEQTGVSCDWTREGCRVHVNNLGETMEDARRMPVVIQRLEASLRTLPGFYKEALDMPMHTDGTPLHEILENDRQNWLEKFSESRKTRDAVLKMRAG